MKNILKLYRYIRDERNRLITVAVVSTVLSAAGLISPLFFRHVINLLTSVSTGHPVPHLQRSVLLVVLALGGLQLLDNIFEFIQERLTDRVSIDIEVKLRERIYAHMMDLSIDFYEQTRVGETVAKTQNALYQFVYWLRGLAESTLTRMIQLVLAIGFLGYINPLIGILVTVLVSAGVAVQIIRIYRSRRVRVEVRQEDEQAYGHMNETIAHITTVRSSMSSRTPTKKYNDILGRYRQATYRMNNIEQYGNVARGIINDGAIVGAVAIIAWQAATGRASAGDVVAVALYLQQITGSIGPLGRLIINTSEVETSVSRITDLLETKPTVVDAPNAVELEALSTLEFKSVTFAYPGKRRKVLENLSFKLETGKTLALVGPSGTGKSTITKLMLRYYEPTGGEILVNGQPVQAFTQESVRAHIGMVMQDVALFNDSVEANLKLAAPEASRSAVRAAATQAHADVFIQNMPEKYETMVGERGVKLSGGEKQRVAIARAILKNPQLIILDEATSALDSESEQHVQAGLHELMENRTAVIIAHRLSTVMQANEIIVLKNGKVVERGVHSDLRGRRGGLYAKLFKLQTEGALA